MSSKNIYYVYQLIDPRDNLPFYVGKGKNDRWKIHLTETINQTDNKRKFYKIQKILRLGLNIQTEFVQENMNEQDAYDLETKLIKFYGRLKLDENGILTNICLDNRPPRTPITEKRRKELSQSMMGNTLNTGRKQSPEERARRAKTLKRIYATGKRVVTDKMRETTRRVHTGKIVSKETRKILSVQKKGKTLEEIMGPKNAAKVRRAARKQGKIQGKIRAEQCSGKTYEEIYGPERGAELRKQKIQERKGKTYLEIFGKEKLQLIKIRKLQNPAYKKMKSVEIDGLKYRSISEATRKTSYTRSQIERIFNEISKKV